MSDLREKIARAIAKSFDEQSAATGSFAASIMADAVLALPELAGWQPIETAPKDGTPILVFFDRPSLGWLRVTWDDPYGTATPENGIWCVDDNKNGPYPVRGYSDGDDKAWMPLPAPLTGAAPAS